MELHKSWTSFIRSGFKIVDQVQVQGGGLNLAGGIYLIFRGKNSTAQHRNWALDAILIPLLPAPADNTGIDTTHAHIDLAGDVAFRRLRIIAHQAAVVGPNLGMDFAFIQVDR